MDIPSWLNDVTVEQLETDPVPVYARLRREVGPLAFIPAFNHWFAITWESCSYVGQDPNNEFLGGTDPALEHVFGQPCVLSVDGDIHRDLRSMLDPYLRPRPVKSYIDPLTRPTVKKLISEFEEGSTVDLTSALFEPVSVRVVGDFLGYRDVDNDTLRRWFHGLSLGFSNKALDEKGNILNPEGFRPSDEVSEEIRAITDPMIERLKKEPDDSGVSHWLHDGMPEGEVRPNEYIYPTLFTILLGGMQEPGHLMGTVVYGLSTRPDQFERVLEDPSLVSTAITEGLRWIAPIQCASSRRTAHDMELFGEKLDADETIFMGFASANHDETQFDNPSTYDMDRPPHPHMAWGAGRHACAGSNFASEVTRIALEELFTTFPRLEKDPDHEVPVRGFFFRGPAEFRAKLLR